MNANSLRRSLRIVAATLAVGTALLLLMESLFPKVVGLQIENKGVGRNHAAITHATETAQPKD